MKAQAGEPVTGILAGENEQGGDEDFRVLGYIHTHADCPHCSEPNEYEGDCAGDEVQCTACCEKFEIREVR